MSTTTQHITHEQAHGLRTGVRTRDDWAHGVSVARRHASQPSVLHDGQGSVLLAASYTQALADQGWSEGDVMAAAYWAGYTAGGIRYGKVPGMAVIAR